jgi:hypothetical protein
LEIKLYAGSLSCLVDGRRRGEEDEEGGVELRRAASILLPTLADRASKGSTLSLAHSVSRYQESAISLSSLINLSVIIIVLLIFLLSHVFLHIRMVSICNFRGLYL